MAKLKEIKQTDGFGIFKGARPFKESKDDHEIENTFNIKSNDELMSLGREETWQVFEQLVAHIFGEHGFKTVQNKVVVFSSKKKRQYDVIAENSTRLYLVECKKWSNGRYKNSALKKSVLDHYKRCYLYKELTSKPIIPLLVSLHQEDILFHERIPIVPLEKLNAFLLSVDTYSLEEL